MMAIQVGEYERAVEDYTQALQVDPQNSYAYYNRGITRDRSGDYEGAITDFTHAITLDPANADFFHNRGFSLRKMVSAVYKHFCLAMPHTTAAALGAVSNEVVHKAYTQNSLVVLAVLLQIGSSSKLAPHAALQWHIAQLQREFACRSNDHCCRSNDHCCAVQGRFEEALRDYSAAIQLNPRHCRAFYNRAFSNDRLRRYDAAVADYTRALDIQPGNATAYHNRASLFERLGRSASALDLVLSTCCWTQLAFSTHHAMSAKVEAGMKEKQQMAISNLALLCLHMCSAALSDIQLLMCVCYDQKSLDLLQYTQLGLQSPEGDLSSHVMPGLAELKGCVF